MKGGREEEIAAMNLGSLSNYGDWGEPSQVGKTDRFQTGGKENLGKEYHAEKNRSCAILKAPRISDWGSNPKSLIGRKGRPERARDGREEKGLT